MGIQLKSIFTKTNTSMLAIYLLLSLFILSQSYLNQDGYVSSDSAHYLQMALNLLHGNGMTTPSYVPDISTYFATWPVGYPVLIAGISFLTGISVFWASKLVNLIMLGLSFVLIKRLFKARAPVVVMIFFISTFTVDFSYTWSEVPFFFGMIWRFTLWKPNSISTASI
ncbi:hypothetical protein GCM10008986_10520 [Salinibacillus aidingensis]|uniref:Dolichyl-phosphate-mannose-protein mannosyltransferase n=1 Tax=Salinibacillus aidingensis TaxID=237684 RepID=A0ABP3KU09_9BACI